MDYGMKNIIVLIAGLLKEKWINDFLGSIIGKIYKVLPLKEEGNSYLPEYLDSLLVQLKGALVTYPGLSSNVRYITVINCI